MGVNLLHDFKLVESSNGGRGAGRHLLDPLYGLGDKPDAGRGFAQVASLIELLLLRGLHFFLGLKLFVRFTFDAEFELLTLLVQSRAIVLASNLLDGNVRTGHRLASRGCIVVEKLMLRLLRAYTIVIELHLNLLILLWVCRERLSITA